MFIFQQISQLPSTTCTQTPPLSMPPQQTSQTPKHSQCGNQPKGRTCVYKPVRKYGFGKMVDHDTGQSVYNPGLSSEKVIKEGTHAKFMQNANPQTKFPIPNEKEIRRSSAVTSGSRKIEFIPPTDLPLAIQPPRLQWKGQPSISSSELRIQSQQILTR